MKRFLKIALFTLISAIILRLSLDTAIAAIELNIQDVKIQELLLREDIRVNKQAPVTLERLQEKMELVLLVREYIETRRRNPFVSRLVTIGSTEVLVEVTKYMMYEALGHDPRKVVVLMKEGPGQSFDLQDEWCATVVLIRKKENRSPLGCGFSYLSQIKIDIPCMILKCYSVMDSSRIIMKIIIVRWSFRCECRFKSILW